jgi:hypothetical protein
LHANGTKGGEAEAVLPALIILALWVALLTPGVVKWLRNHKPSTSIASFHRQLRLLEHTGPNLVEPAYRLEGEDERLTEWEEPPPPARVPRLVLLPTGETPKESTTMRHHRQDRYEDRYEDLYANDDVAHEPAWDDPWAPGAAAYEPVTRSHRTVRTPRYDEYEYEHDASEDAPEPMHVLTPARARSRRTRILWSLGGAIVASFIFGLLPGLGVLWAVSLLGLVALIGYLALMFYASNVGLYGNDGFEQLTPVARTVISPSTERASRYDDEGWQSDRVAAAR